MTERFPRRMLTRPIPQVVVEAVQVAVNERFAGASCGENRGEDKLASVSYVRELLVKRYAQRAAVKMPSLKSKRISPHTIRHTTATLLLRSGVDINTIRA